ncbi:MAG: hypothetical protein IPI67_34075 [Myxococcales bacterium]|nr:hypothetical protein [Myxococcales bacterium]
MQRSIALPLLLVFGSACTTLGPMPAITAQSVVPTPRTGVEAQIAGVPGYYLSESVQENPRGATIGQAAVMFEPGELIGAPGLAIGGRYVGKKDSGGYPEPMLRYRTGLDDKQVFSVGALAFGGYGHGSNNGASYEATRVGAEVGVDVLMSPPSKYLEVHFAGSLGLTGLDANGDYCLDANGRFGVDCGDPPFVLSHAKASGFYSSASGAIALDFARRLHGIMHGGRLALYGAVGRMPRVEAAEQKDGKTYTAIGLSITLGLGASEPD